MSINKKDIISKVKDRTIGFEDEEIETLVNTTLKVLADAIASGDKVCIHGIGSFNVTERPGYETYSEFTGKNEYVKPTKSISYKPSKSIKEKLNK